MLRGAAVKRFGTRTPASWCQRALITAALLSAIGCQVDSPVTVPSYAREYVGSCGYCEATADATIAQAGVDTIVVTTHRLLNETDCRSCVEDGRCEVVDRSCACLGEEIPLEAFRDEATWRERLAPVEFPPVTHRQQYCVSIAMLSVGDAPGPDCTCTPETWAVPPRSTRSCTYSRRGTSPADGRLVLDSTLCHNPLPNDGLLVALGLDGESAVRSCQYADIYLEALRNCSGVTRR